MIDTTSYTQLHILKRHWALAVFVGLSVIAVIVPVSLGLPNLYRATTQLVIERRQTAQPSVVSLETRLIMIKQEALSRARLIELIDRLNLYPELRERVSLDAAISRVETDISVTPFIVPTGNGVQSALSFAVSFRAEDPKAAADVANTLASFYVAQNDALRNRQVSGAVQDLQSSVNEAKKRLDAAIERQQSFITRFGSQLPDQLQVKQQQLGRLTGDLMGKNTRLMQARNEEKNIRQNIAQEMNRPTPPGTVSTLEQQLAAAELEVKTLRDNGATDNVPGMASKIARIQQLKDQIRARGPVEASRPATLTTLDVLNQSLKATTDEIKELETAIADLDQRSTTLQTQISSIPSRNPEYDNLTRDVEAARNVFDTQQRLFSTASISEHVEHTQDGEEFRVRELARPPDTPAGPNRLNLILGGIVAGLVLGVAAAFVRDRLDTSFHSMDELRQFTQVPVLAAIPQITTAQQKASRATTLVVAALLLGVGLSAVSAGAFHYAQRKVGISRLVTK